MSTLNRIYVHQSARDGKPVSRTSLCIQAVALSALFTAMPGWAIVQVSGLPPE